MEPQRRKSSAAAPRRGWRILGLGGILACLLGTSAAAALTTPAAPTGGTSLAERGRYLALAGNCGGCHTRPGGKPFAGGLALHTRFGTIYTSNLTPDQKTGIGGWSEADFYHALHDGRAPDGTPYYPAFPYPFFTKLTRDDVEAIRAYLATLKPVRYKVPKNRLEGPLGFRPLLYGWQLLFFHKGTFEPDPKRSAAYNRGAYLTDALGHCGACHTPRNILGARRADHSLTGAKVDGWYAPDITADARSALRRLSINDVATVLKTGTTPPKRPGSGPRTTVLGSMAEVVHDSLSHLAYKDLQAIATYLKKRPLPAGATAIAAAGASREMAALGAKVYADNCAACHGDTGAGTPPAFTALRGNPLVIARDPANVIRVILAGAPTGPKEQLPGIEMPAFGEQLTDTEVAAVVNYIRHQWGNNAVAVKPKDVKVTRRWVPNAEEQG